MKCLLENMKDVFYRIHIWNSCWNSRFSSVNLIPGRSDYHTVLWKITILQEKVAFCVSSFLNILEKCLQTNEKNFQLFFYHRNSPLQLHSFSMPLMLYYSKIPCCSFVTSFYSKTEIKSLSRLSGDHSYWSSDLLKNISFYE